MFTKERVIPLVSLAVFAFGVVGLLWGAQLGMDRLADSIPPLVYVPLVVVADVARRRWVDRKPDDRTDWMSTILSASVLILLGFETLARRNGDPQARSYVVPIIFVILLLACFSLADLLRKRREDEQPLEPRDKGPYG